MTQTIVLILDRKKPESHTFTDYVMASNFYKDHQNRAEVLAIFWLDDGFNLHRYSSV